MKKKFYTQSPARDCRPTKAGACFGLHARARGRSGILSRQLRRQWIADLRSSRLPQDRLRVPGMVAFPPLIAGNADAYSGLPACAPSRSGIPSNRKRSSGEGAGRRSRPGRLRLEHPNDRLRLERRSPPSRRHVPAARVRRQWIADLRSRSLRTGASYIGRDKPLGSSRDRLRVRDKTKRACP